MIDYVMESPWVVVLTGLSVAAVLLVALVQTGRSGFLVGLIGVAIATVALLTAERMIITPREQVARTVYQLADDLQANNRAAVLAAIDPQAVQIRDRAAGSLDAVKISEARVTGGLTVTINRLTSPPTAEASFMGRLQLSETRLGLGTRPFISRFTLNYVEVDGRWLIENYSVANAPGR